MTDRKNRKNRLVAVRLSDAEYEHLIRCAASGKVPVKVSSYIRDLIGSAGSLMHEREILASVRKMQTDLSFCLGILRSGAPSDETDLLIRILTDIDTRLKRMERRAPWQSQNSHI